MALLLLGGLLGAFGGCREARYAPKADFVDLYVDLKLASVVFTGDTGRANEARKVVLAQHGRKPSDFRREYRRLMDHPDAWMDFQNQVNRRLAEIEKNGLKFSPPGADPEKEPDRKAGPAAKEPGPVDRKKRN